MEDIWPLFWLALFGAAFMVIVCVFTLAIFPNALDPFKIPEPQVRIPHTPHIPLSTKQKNVREVYFALVKELKLYSDVVGRVIETAKTHIEEEDEDLKRVIEVRNQFLAVDPEDYQEFMRRGQVLAECLKAVAWVTNRFPSLDGSGGSIPLKMNIQIWNSQILTRVRGYNSAVTVLRNHFRLYPQDVDPQDRNFEVYFPS